MYLIYFTDPAKKLIYTRFGEALNPKQIFNPSEFQLTFFDTFFYQRN